MPEVSHTGSGTLTAAKLVRWTGYGLSFVLGLILWPRLFEWGFRMENSQFGLALLFNWFCLPVSMTITHVVSWIAMRGAARLDPQSSGVNLRAQIQTASMLGIIASLGSCGVIASGYVPPEPFYSIYDLDLTGKYQ